MKYKRDLAFEDANAVGLYAIYMWEGVAPNWRLKMIKIMGSEIAAVDWFSRYALSVARFVAKDDREYPGNFAYDIAPLLGLWLAKHLCASVREFEAYMRFTVKGWINQYQTEGVQDGNPSD